VFHLIDATINERTTDHRKSISVEIQLNHRNRERGLHGMQQVLRILS